MFRRVSKTEAAARRSSTMEGRDHSNAAIPKSLMSRGNKMITLGVALCVAMFVACSPSLKSSGEKLGQQACDCQKKYAEAYNTSYQEFILKFDSYGFKNRIEPRQKWQELQDEVKKLLCKVKPVKD